MQQKFYAKPIAGGEFDVADKDLAGRFINIARLLNDEAAAVKAVKNCPGVLALTLEKVNANFGKHSYIEIQKKITLNRT